MTAILTWSQFEQMNEEGRLAKLVAVGKEVVKDTAVFQQTCDLLSYHNQLSSLIALLQTAAAHMQTSSNASEWQRQTVTALLMDHLIFQFLESSPPDKATASPELKTTLQAIVPIEAAGLNRYLAHLSGYTQYQWELVHLAEHPPQNMAALLIEFLAYAKNEARVPYGRTNLVRNLLPTYFVERRTGQLNPRQDLGDLMRRGRPIPKPPSSYHPLAPNSETLQRFIAKQLNYDPVRPYAAAAIFTLLPTWLRFLQSRSLLTDNDASATLADLANLKPELHAYFAGLAADDRLAAAVSRWPAD